jgi:hypothetical protein
MRSGDDAAARHPSFPTGVVAREEAYRGRGGFTDRGDKVRVRQWL